MNKRWTIQDVEALGLRTDLNKNSINRTDYSKTGHKNAENAKNIPLSAKQNYQALGRLKSGEMNETEKKYAERLNMLKHAGEVLWWEFEPMNLRLADRCFYRVDFLVLAKSGQLEVHEVKGGYITDDALVKIKIAAQKFPFRFIICQFKKGEWVKREF